MCVRVCSRPTCNITFNTHWLSWNSCLSFCLSLLNAEMICNYVSSAGWDSRTQNGISTWGHLWFFYFCYYCCFFVCLYLNSRFLKMNFVTENKVLQCQKVGYTWDRHEPLLPDKSTCYQRQNQRFYLSTVVVSSPWGPQKTTKETDSSKCKNKVYCVHNTSCQGPCQSNGHSNSKKRRCPPF